MCCKQMPFFSAACHGKDAKRHLHHPARIAHAPCRHADASAATVRAVAESCAESVGRPPLPGVVRQASDLNTHCCDQAANIRSAIEGVDIVPSLQAQVWTRVCCTNQDTAETSARKICGLAVGTMQNDK